MYRTFARTRSRPIPDAHRVPQEFAMESDDTDGGWPGILRIRVPVAPRTTTKVLRCRFGKRSARSADRQAA